MAPNAGDVSWLFRPSLQALKLPSCHLPEQSHHSFAMKTFYFAYGSNMNQEQMADRCPGSEIGPLIRLAGWRYFINGRGYAGVEESPADQVLGCLWSLDD